VHECRWSHEADVLELAAQLPHGARTRSREWR
jgi:hypothetical protein